MDPLAVVPTPKIRSPMALALRDHGPPRIMLLVRELWREMFMSRHLLLLLGFAGVFVL
jgi:hypothetical protein